MCVCVCACACVRVCTRRHDAQIIRAPCVRIRSVSSGGRGADVAGASESTAQPQVLMPLEACMQCSAQASRKGSPVSQPAFRSCTAGWVPTLAFGAHCGVELGPHRVGEKPAATGHSGFPLRRDKLGLSSAPGQTRPHLRRDCSSARDARRLVHTKLGDQVAECKEVAVHLHSHTHKCHTHTRARACTHTPNTETHTAAAARGSERILG